MSIFSTSPKISVITVCFNVVNSLQRTINSVINQTYLNIEYIIVDGGSKDGTKENVLSFGPKIARFISEPDSGLYDAMNKGIALASGEFIIFLNAGDYFTCEYALEAFLSKSSDKSVDVFFGKIVWIDTTNMNVITSDHSSVEYAIQLKTENFPHPATLYRKDAFEKYGKFSLEFPVLADYEWNLRALIKLKAKFKYIDTIVTNFYTGGISTSEDYRTRIEKEQILLNSMYFERLGADKNLNTNWYSKLLKSPRVLRLNRA